MKNTVKFIRLIALAAALNCLSACATGNVSNASVCLITFDYSDEGIDFLNTDNLRALADFKEMCK